jgi:hypothetical protein
MTPEIDAGFAQIGQERVAHSRFRYYVVLPAKRAMTLWFDTHSQYYPFNGELLPLPISIMTFTSSTGCRCCWIDVGIYAVGCGWGVVVLAFAELQMVVAGGAVDFPAAWIFCEPGESRAAVYG